jgi:hypothetical protein
MTIAPPRQFLLFLGLHKSPTCIRFISIIVLLLLRCRLIIVEKRSGKVGNEFLSEKNASIVLTFIDAAAFVRTEPLF